MFADLPLIEETIRHKMTARKIEDARIAAFLRDVRKVHSGESALIHETSIESLDVLPAFDAIQPTGRPPRELLKKLVVIKLNGGLGTGMGLNKAKSLITVKPGLCFLDLIAQQIQHLRHVLGIQQPLFQLMNSFSTQADCLHHLAPMVDALGDGKAIDFLQGQVPKLNANDLLPVAWGPQPSLEWAPPGHGDIYLSMESSGLLDQLLSQGIQYAFVSNADNLGASVSLELLDYFATSETSFMMEVARRTASDRKGGHLSKRSSDARLILRESAQCPDGDLVHFQDIQRHRFFNTNNLWFRLDHMKSCWEGEGAGIELPLIQNTKHVDPKNAASPEVIQIESAMGAAIECFDATCAVEVPRQRFSPVKNTGDLLALRSDAYETTPEHRLELHQSRQGQPPLIQLDSNYFKVLEHFEKRIGQQTPSLLECESLTVDGPVIFEPGVVLKGNVYFNNTSQVEQSVKSGTYQDDKIEWK